MSTHETTDNKSTEIDVDTFLSYLTSARRRQAASEVVHDDHPDIRTIPFSSLSGFIDDPGTVIDGFIPAQHRTAGLGDEQSVRGFQYRGEGRYVSLNVSVSAPSIAMRALARIMRTEPKAYLSITESWHDS